ncbi:MAG: hypothetical protein IJF29_06050 [Firmicutes bacterium]|nr:hypothetical protein [Bacillota bacterium]
MNEERRNRILITCNKAISGSVVYEADRLTVVLNGIDDGVYDIYLSDSHKEEADTRGRGRFIKRINGASDGNVVIKKDGEMIAWTIDDENKAEEMTESTEEESVYENADDENKAEEKEEYSFSTDISSIIARFREQIERLEKESLLDKEDMAYIEGGEKEDKNKENVWKAVCPDDLWMLPIKDMRFPSSLFCIYAYLKFGYIYLLEMSDRYRVAVPDVFKRENMVAASKNGFYSISTLDGKEVKEGEEGYWMADILKN